MSYRDLAWDGYDSNETRQWDYKKEGKHMKTQRKRLAAVLLSATLTLSNLAGILPQSSVLAAEESVQTEMTQAESGSSEAQQASAPAEAAQPAPAPVEAAQPAPAPAEEPAAAAPAESVSTPEPVAEAETPAAPQQESAAPAESQSAQHSAESQQSPSTGKPTEKEGQTAGKAEAVTAYYRAAEGGSVSSASEIVQASSGAQAAGSEAKAAEGFVFKNWTAADGTVVSTSAFFAPQIPSTTNGGSYTYTAHFEKAAEAPATKMVTVEYVAGNGGTVDRNSETVDVLSADAALLGSTATAQEGYQFVDWTASDDSIVSSNASFVPALSADMPEKTVYIANFKKADTMPAQDFEGSVSGVHVNVHADDGRFPEGTTMHLAPVPKSSILSNDSVQDAVGEDKEVVDAIAVDITFQDKDGKEIEPAGTISVNMSTSRDVSGDSHQVLHIDDNGNASQVTDASAEGASFEASEFSIYVITGIGTPEQDPAIATYIFHDADGKDISTQKVKDGETVYAPTTPEKSGYKFVGWSYAEGATALQAGDPGDVDKFKASVSSTGDVKLYPAFKQVYYVFFMDNHNPRRVSTTKEGVNGTVIKVSDVTIPLDSTHSVTGWYTDEALTNKIDSVTLSNQNVTLYPKVEQGNYLYFSSGEGASYVKPVFVAAGKETTEPKAPTRPGYTFKYWSAAEGGSEYSFGSTISEDTTLYAVWEAARNTKYTVIFWKQSVNDRKDAADDAKTYDYAESATRIGITGESVSPTRDDQRKGYTGFTYNRSKSASVTINGDGTTILNVYYDRNLLTINFNTWQSNGWFSGNWSSYKSFTGLYGQTLAQNGYTWPSEYKWYTNKNNNGNTSGTNITFLDAFISDDYADYGSETVLNLYGSEEEGSISINHYKQNLDGSYSYNSPTNNTKSNTGTFTFTNKYTGFTVSSYFTGRNTTNDESRWIPVSAGSSAQYRNNLYVRYTRNSYNLAYYNYNSVVKKESVLYEASLNSNSFSSYVPNRPAGLPEAYTFQGWFKDKECTVAFDFNSTMPANDVMIYAKWAAPTYTGTVHLNIEGTGAPMQLKIDYGGRINENDMPTVKDAEGKVIREGNSTDTVIVPENHTWAGWATKSGDDFTIYNFNVQLYDNIILYPYYINGKSYTVTYNKGEGTGTAPKDSKEYAENSYADIQSAARVTPPEGKTFLYWSDGTNKYYPGDKVKITGDLELTAVYGNTSPVTSITYHSNYPSNSELKEEIRKVDGKANNTVITLEKAGFTAPGGYYFAYWKDDTEKQYPVGTKIGIDNISENDLYAVWEKKKEITLKANSGEFTYDGTEHTVSGVETDTFTINGSTYTVSGFTTDNPVKINAGIYPNNIQNKESIIVKNGDTDVTYQFSVTTINGSLKINPKAVTVKADDKSKTYGEKDPELTAQVSGTLGKDTVSYKLSRVVGEDVGTYAITPSGDEIQGNYKVTYAPGTMTIIKSGEMTLSANGYEGEYDGNTHAASASASVKEGTTISYKVGDGEWTTEAPSIKDVGEQTVNVKAENPNYETVTETVTLKVTPKAVTVKADDKSKTYGEKDPELTAQVSGTLGKDTVSYKLSRDKGENVGEYAITPAGDESQGNYTVTYVSGILKITDDGLDPRLVVTKTHDGKTYQLGEEIEFLIQVTNIYNSAQTIVLNEQEGVNFVGASVFESVKPGDTVTAKATHVVTAEDIANGSYTNHVTASFDSGKKFEADDNVDSFAHLTLSKEVTSRPANGSSYALGEMIRYEITVRNDGTTMLEGVNVKDSLTGEEWKVETLATGESRSFETSWTVTEENIRNGHVLNQATGSATDGDGDPVEPVPGKADEPTEAQNPALYLEKTSDKEGEVKLGETLTYTIRVLNNGNETLKNVTVTDEMTGDVWKAGTLKPGEFRIFETKYTVTEADLLKGSVLNRVTATGKDPDGKDPTVVPGETENPTEPVNAHLMLKKTTTSHPKNKAGYTVGEAITYQIEAFNDGNLTLTDVEVTDPLTGDTWKVEKLAPGEKQTFETKYKVTEKDQSAGKVVNKATAKGKTPGSTKLVVVPGATSDPVLPKANDVMMTSTAVPTGDPTQTGAYLAMLLVAAAGIVLLSRKKKEEHR